MTDSTEYERRGKIKDQVSIEPSTIETIDFAVFQWLTETMNVHTNTNKGWKKTPVVWSNGERAFQLKFDRTLRDVNGNFILPVIAVQRDSVVKSLSRKGTFYANVPANDFRGGVLTVAKLISQEKSGNFARNNNQKTSIQYNVKNKNKKVVYEVTEIPLPVYVDVQYTITINSEYQQQMNDLIQPFMVFTSGNNYFKVFNEQHVFEAFFEKDSTFKNGGNSTKLDEQTRLFTTDFTINVLGYLLGAGADEDKPKIITSETIVEIKLPREREMLSESEISDKKLF